MDVAGSALSWNGATWTACSTYVDPGGPLKSVSCPTSTFCVAVGDGNTGTPANGSAFTWNGATWSAGVQVDTGSLTSVSCPTTTFCAAVDNAFSAFTLQGSTWSGAAAAADPTEAVSCSSATFCVAVEHGGTLMWNGASWTQHNGNVIPGLSTPTSVACTSATFCSVVDDGGNGATWNGGSWNATLGIDPSTLQSVACVSASSCFAVDGLGSLVSWTGTTWDGPGTIDAAGELTGISCGSSVSCVAVDGTGNVLTAAPAPPLPYTPVTPTRICDTRHAGAGVSVNQCDEGDPGPLSGGQYLTVTGGWSSDRGHRSRPQRHGGGAVGEELPHRVAGRDCATQRLKPQRHSRAERPEPGQASEQATR